VKVEVVQALALDWHAVIAGYFAARARGFEGELADSAALFALDVPLPSSHCIPGVYLDLHLLFSNYYS